MNKWEKAKKSTNPFDSYYEEEAGDLDNASGVQEETTSIIERRELKDKDNEAENSGSVTENSNKKRSPNLGFTNIYDRAESIEKQEGDKDQSKLIAKRRAAPLDFQNPFDDYGTSQLIFKAQESIDVLIETISGQKIRLCNLIDKLGIRMSSSRHWKMLCFN